MTATTATSCRSPTGFGTRCRSTPTTSTGATAIPDQPAEVVARLKLSYPRWAIMRVEHGPGLTAHRGSEHVWAPTPAELDTKLSAIGHRRGPKPIPRTSRPG